MDHGGIDFAVSDEVCLITLNRPERLNALSDDMHTALDHAWLKAARTDDACVIVLTGAGRAFSAGADMARLDRLAGGDA